MRKLTLLLTGSPVYLNESLRKRPEEEEENYFADNQTKRNVELKPLPQAAAKVQSSGSIFSCCRADNVAKG
jgi:hypothetical protein